MNSLQGISVPFTWGAGEGEGVFNPKTTLSSIIQSLREFHVSQFSLLYFCYLTDGVKKNNKILTRKSPKDAPLKEQLSINGDLLSQKEKETQKAVGGRGI